MPSAHTGETVGPQRRRKFLEALAEEPSVRKACRTANIGRTTLYALRENDPAFRQAWDKAMLIGRHVLIDVAVERGVEGLSDGLLKWQIQSHFPEYQDQPKTVNQNLSLRLMSPEQREEEAGRILLRIAALGIPLISIDGEAIDISDLQAEAEAVADPASRAEKALNRPERPSVSGHHPEKLL